MVAVEKTNRPACQGIKYWKPSQAKEQGWALRCGCGLLWNTREYAVEVLRYEDEVSTAKPWQQREGGGGQGDGRNYTESIN